MRYQTYILAGLILIVIHDNQKVINNMNVNVNVSVSNKDKAVMRSLLSDL